MIDYLEEMIRKEDRNIAKRERKVALENKACIERGKKREGLHRGKRIKKDSVLDMLNPNSNRTKPHRKRYARFVKYSDERKGEKGQ